MHFFHPTVDCEKHDAVHPGDVFTCCYFVVPPLLSVHSVHLSRGILGRANSLGSF